MKLEITRELKNPQDFNIANNISQKRFTEACINSDTNFFAYFADKLIGILDITKKGESVFIDSIYIHQKLKYNQDTNSSYGIGSALILNLIDSMIIGEISLVSTSADSNKFYANIGFDQNLIFSSGFASRNIYQIRQNLELRLKSPGYAKLTEEDLVTLGL